MIALLLPCHRCILAAVRSTVGAVAALAAPTAGLAARQGGGAGRRGWGAMTIQPARDRPVPRPGRSPRRVVLNAVVRRDAAQRLSLALTLLARASDEGGGGGSTGGERRAIEPAPRPEHAQER